MKPTDHSRHSVRRYGGLASDYIHIHEFLDMTKAAHPDMRHRAILHHSMGPFIAVQAFGISFLNSDGKEIDVRQVCEDHIIEDMGFLPTVSYFLDMIPESKMSEFAHKNKKQVIVD